MKLNSLDHAAGRWLVGAIFGMCVVALVAATFQGDSWEERDQAGRVRLRGRFEVNGDYVLSLFDGTGRESFKLVSSSAGGGSLSIADSVTLESGTTGGVLVLKGKAGATARIGTEGGGSNMLLESPGGGRVSMESTNDGGRIEVSNGKSAVVWLSDGVGSRLQFGGKESPAVEIRDDVNGDKGVYIGLAERTGRISMTANKKGAVGLTLESSAHKPRVLIQDAPSQGTGIVICYDSGAPAMTVGLKADGGFATELFSPDGKRLDALVGSEAKK